jgi:hypothetical protein
VLPIRFQGIPGLEIKIYGMVNKTGLHLPEKNTMLIHGTAFMLPGI